MNPHLFFSDYFDVSPSTIEDYGALNVCLEADLPLFIDPFLLFASENPEYRTLHERIVSHLLHLKSIALDGKSPHLALFTFPEIKQNWLGWSKWGNRGRGLGPKFGRTLIKAFNGFYRSFGEETMLESSHIEKLTLVGSGIGRDFISDFTTNLALEFLLRYTQEFASRHLRDDQTASFSVRCTYDPSLRVWTPRSFRLPCLYRSDSDHDFVLLTPIDILTKDEAFISHSSFINQFGRITSALQNSQLRDGINHFFRSVLPQSPRKADIERAIERTVEEYPEILDYYIRSQELRKGEAAALSLDKVQQLKKEVIEGASRLIQQLSAAGTFYTTGTSSYEEALLRVKFLKDVIEKNDGYRIFYADGKAVAKEDTIQRIFRLTWFASPHDVNAEVNNGRGPVDYKVSMGARDSAIVEFKLASSSSLERNLLNQVDIYKSASKAVRDISVILCYSTSELAKVDRVLRKLGIHDAENVVVIDASPKVSASRA